MITATNSKQRHIMMITSDKRIAEQVRTTNNPSSFQTIILEPGESDNELPESSSSNDKQSIKQKKSKNNSLICVVCGSSAHGYNFGVITCESCKLFFRRNGLKNPVTLSCRHNNECEIKFETRRYCSACRLNKCLNNGMNRDRLLKAEEKTTKRYKIKEHQINEQRFQPILTSRDINPLSTSSTQLFLQVSFQSQRAMLSSEDFERIEAVRTAFEKRIELAARDGLQWNPSIFAINLSQHLNARSVSAMRLLAFFKQIPEFNQLNIDDKIILIKYNLMPLIILNYALSFKLDTKQIVETDNDVPWNSSILRTLHGNEIYMQITKIFESFVRIAKYDQKIIQLALIVLILTKSLSTGDGAPEPILNDGMTVYRAHNSYTELLWKYMETMYGNEQAFRIITNLITRFLTWQIIEKKLRYNVEQDLSRTEENDLLPLMKSLFHIS